MASNPVYLIRCLFLLYSLLLCVAYSCAVVDEKDHTPGAIQCDKFQKSGIVLMYKPLRIQIPFDMNRYRGRSVVDPDPSFVRIRNLVPDPDPKK
jgi:hypothetical protein